jgi:hypothetical protein
VRAVVLGLLAALVAAPTFCQTLELTGLDGQSKTLSAAEIAALPPVRVSVAGHGPARTFEGPRLIDLLALVGAPTGKALGGHEMADVAVVSAADGYTVAIGLAEADPGTRPNAIILANRVDGAPLDAKEGPYKLVVEGDLRGARGARMVRRISLVGVSPAP